MEIYKWSFNSLGIGIEPAIKYLMGVNTKFDQFENWIEENGRISAPIIKQFNSIIDKENSDKLQITEKIFNKTDLEQWEKEASI